MQIAIFTLCDYAQNYGGKSIIVGTFNQISSKSFPFVHNTFSIVGRIEYETPGTKRLKLEILDPNGANVVLPSEWSNGINMPDPTKIASVEFNIALNQVQFKEAGTYEVKLYCENEIRVSKLYVTPIV